MHQLQAGGGGPGGGGHIEDIDGALSTQYTCFVVGFSQYRNT